MPHNGHLYVVGADFEERQRLKGPDGQERFNDDGVLQTPHCNLQNVVASIIR